MLTQEEKQNILREFPNVKLSYEKIIHKKVYNCDLAIVIPEGKKSFIWFTSLNDKMVCLLLELDNKNKKEIKNIKIMNSCFSRTLCYGTIFYGTFFYHLNNPFFSIEDIFMYKGQDILNINMNSKFTKICDILKNDIKQISYNDYCLVFGLPIITTNCNNIKHILETVKYKLSCIKYYNKNNNNSHLSISIGKYLEDNEIQLNEEKIREENICEKISDGKISHEKISDEKIKEEKKEINNNTFKRDNFNKQITKIFIIKPDIQNDIYHLYSLDNHYTGIACIPDYKTSVMMNNLFRNIKENNDLDALEESDDEEEFENHNIDKFVNLDKSYKMICNLNTKFKKWVPIKITD